MSAAAVVEPDNSGAGPWRALAKFPDFLVLAIALPIFILADWPIAGWATAAVAWVIATLVITYMEIRALHATETRKQVGLIVGAGLVRAWISAAAILTAGVAFGDDAGLACALLTIVLFTVYFLNKMFFHMISPEQKA